MKKLTNKTKQKYKTIYRTYIVKDPTQTRTGASTCRPRFDTAVLHNFRSKRDGLGKERSSLNPQKMKDFNKKRLNLL